MTTHLHRPGAPAAVHSPGAPAAVHSPGRPNGARMGGDRIAFLLLRSVYTVAPILFGLDKFARILTDDWERYLAPWIDHLIPGPATTAMAIVGVVEVVAGVVAALWPRYGGLLIAAWLAGIIVSLVSVGGYLDIALRDFGLLVGALALSALAFARHSAKQDRPHPRGPAPH